MYVSFDIWSFCVEIQPAKKNFSHPVLRQFDSLISENLKMVSTINFEGVITVVQFR
jgi:hypothetical protein